MCKVTQCFLTTVILGGRSARKPLICTSLVGSHSLLMAVQFVYLSYLVTQRELFGIAHVKTQKKTNSSQSRDMRYFLWKGDTNHCVSTLKLAGYGNTTKSGELCVIIVVKYVPGTGSFRCFYCAVGTLLKFILFCLM